MGALLKFVLVAVLVALVLWWGLGGARRIARRTREPLPAPQGLLRCAHCGLHLPASDVLRDAAGQPFCSAAHRDAGARDLQA